MRERTGLVEKSHPKFSLRRQCELLGVARSSLDYVPVPENAADQLAKRRLDELYLKDPWFGSRRLPEIDAVSNTGKFICGRTPRFRSCGPG